MQPTINIGARQYIEKEIQHIEDKYSIILSKNADALQEAKKEMERRLEGMNEFRAQLEKQTKTFISRDEFSATEKLILQKVENISKLVYIGFGVFLMLQIIIGVFLTLIFKI
jgi:hypothetical protein